MNKNNIYLHTTIIIKDLVNQNSRIIYTSKNKVFND